MKIQFQRHTAINIEKSTSNVIEKFIKNYKKNDVDFVIEIDYNENVADLYFSETEVARDVPLESFREITKSGILSNGNSVSVPLPPSRKCCGRK